MSEQHLNENNNNLVEKEEINDPNDSINQNNINSNSQRINKSKLLKDSKIIYPYPIFYHNKKDPYDDYKLRIINSRNKGNDTFLKNYLKFNFDKNDFLNNRDIKNNNINYINQNILEDKKNNLFITENKNVNISSNMTEHKDESINAFSYKRILNKSKSEVYNIYSKKSINQYRNSYLKEMEKRSNQYNKIKLASLQRIALQNFSSMSSIDSHFVNGSIPSGKSDESYILETKKRKKLPGFREYICYRLKKMKENKSISPEYYKKKNKREERNKLPEIIDIKNSGLFKFHVFHDQYGFKKELDKKENKILKITDDKIRDFKIMSKIIKTRDPELIDIYKRVTYDDI